MRRTPVQLAFTKINMFLLVALAWCCIATGPLHAAVRGRVSDRATGQPLPHATVRLGTAQLEGDTDGSFTLPNTHPGDTISISYVGYRPQAVVLTDAVDYEVLLDQIPSQLGDILVTAQRSDRTVMRTPRTSYRASAADIEHAGAQTATDAMRLLPGVAMTDAGSFRARPVVRGLYGSRVLVLVDGERQNDQREVSDFAGVSLSLVDVNNIDRVEVVSGAASPLYGSDAMGGVINVITKKPSFTDGLHLNGSYSGRYSSNDQQQSHRLEFGVATSQWYMNGNAMWRQTDRNFRPPKNWQNKAGFGIFDQAAYDRIAGRSGHSFGDVGLVNSQAEVNNLDFRIGAKLSEQSRLEAATTLFRGNYIGYPGVPNDSTPFYFYYPQHDRREASLAYVNTQVGGLLRRFESKLYVQQVQKLFSTDFLGSLRIPTGPGGPTIVPQTADSRTNVTKVGWSIQQQFGTDDRHTAIVGADFWTEKYRGDVTEQTLFDFSSPGPPDQVQTTVRSSVPDSRWNALGIFGQYHLQAGKLSIESGLRYDLFGVTAVPTGGYVDSAKKPLPATDDQYHSFSGSLGLLLPISDGVSSFATAGSAYRVPNTVERFFYGQQEGRNIRPNPSITPERSYSLEAGFKGIQPTISYSLAGFYNVYDHFIQLRSPGANIWQYQNVQHAVIYGSEMLIEGRLSMGLYTNLAVSYQHGDSKANGDQQPLFVAPLTSTLTAGWRTDDRRTFAEVSLRKVENQNRVARSTALDDMPTRGFSVVNLAAGFRAFEGVRVTGSLNNLFDKLYSEPFNARGPDNPIPEPGRNLILSVAADLF